MTDAVDAYTPLAARYDRLEKENRILRHMRSRSLAALVRFLPPHSRLVEFGCGTGSEAVAVSRRLSARVTAFEPNEELVELARKKARSTAGRVDVVRATTSEALKQLSGERLRFDGAWASFSLAYERPLSELGGEFARVLRPGGVLVVSLPNPWRLSTPWSMPSRRLGWFRHKVGEARVRIRIVSAHEAVDEMERWFEPVHQEALCALVPPPRAGRVWNRFPALANAVELVDGALGDKWPWRSLGDHTLLVLRRRGADGTGAGAMAAK